LRIVFATLARRLPGLRLAKRLDELEVRTTLSHLRRIQTVEKLHQI
jgi:hypothetical protein